MAIDNVVDLKVVPTSAPKDLGTFADSVIGSLVLSGVLEDWDETDLELEAVQTDEQELGPMTADEKKCFVVGSILRTMYDTEMRELHASTMEAEAEAIRSKKSDPSMFPTTPTPDAATTDRINTLSIAANALVSMYEYTVRARFASWSKRIIVRDGFVVVCYG